MAVPEELGPFVDRPQRAGVFTDFDGTLADVVDDPAAAVAVEGAVEVLQRLAGHVAVVGVVSGRPVSYLRDRLADAPGLRLSGLYGLETYEDGRQREAEEAAAWRPVVDASAGRALRTLGDLVEHKGLSLTLHFRTAPERADEVRAWADAEARATDLVVRPAKASVELHPPVVADKGTALEALADGLDSVCFLGDDVGDLPAFDALDRLQVAGVHVVRIGVRSVEAPAPIIARADLLVDGPRGAVELLTSLLP